MNCAVTVNVVTRCLSFSQSYCLVPRRLSRYARKGRLPMVPCGSSPVTRFALASAMRKTKRLRRRLAELGKLGVTCK